jgi:hypothetical protein
MHAFLHKGAVLEIFSIRARSSWLEARSSIKNLQNENTYSIYKRRHKNSLCRIVPVCIDVKSKKDRIGQQAKSTNGCYEFVGIKKQVYEFNKTDRGEL